MQDKTKKYFIICPLGIVLFVILSLVMILIWPDADTFWQWWLIGALVIVPMYLVGDYLDKNVFKVKGSLARVKEKGISLVEKNPEDFMECPHCGMSVRKGAEFCGYCAGKIA